MNIKTLINNFSRNAFTYEQFASVQKKCANDLIKLIPGSKYKNILEIGCGTGIFTKMLREKFSSSEITSIDISSSMIEIARQRFLENEICFLNADIEDLKLEQEFEAVTSNVSLHWVTDLYATVKNIAQHTSSKGLIAASIYGPGTFDELKQVLSVLYGRKKWLSSSSFKTKDEIHSAMFKYFRSIDISERNIQMVYPDIWTYLYSMKRTGTRGDGIGKYIKLTKNRIHEIEKKYLELYGGIKATHNIFFCKGIKI